MKFVIYAYRLNFDGLNFDDIVNVGICVYVDDRDDHHCESVCEEYIDFRFS